MILMKNVSLYIDLAFCLVFLPLMMLVFPVERWWGTYPLFFTSFVIWLYVTYFILLLSAKHNNPPPNYL